MNENNLPTASETQNKLPEELEIKVLGFKSTNPGKQTQKLLIIILVFILILVVIIGLWLKANPGIVAAVVAGSGITGKLGAIIKKIRSP